MTKKRVITITEADDGYVADDLSETGAPLVGRGHTVLHALGAWCLHHRGDLNLEIQRPEPSLNAHKTVPLITNHQMYTRSTQADERPELPRLTADDFVRAKYSQGDKHCYTARMLELFLQEDNPYVAAYKEFRLATMDYLYHHHRDDHAQTAEQRAACWNKVAENLGYELVEKEAPKPLLVDDMLALYNLRTGQSATDQPLSAILRWCRDQEDFVESADGSMFLQASK